MCRVALHVKVLDENTLFVVRQLEVKPDECVLPGDLDFSGRIRHLEVNIVLLP